MAGTTDSPGDVPDRRPAALTRLEALVGKWVVAASFEAGYFASGSPATTMGGGRTTFEWLDGSYFLIQRFSVEHPAAPNGIAIIGVGTSAETFTQHYYDSRGVARVYEMTLQDGVWKLRREAPGFWQRYAGVFSDDGSTISGAWEGSSDGVEWEHDFKLTYTKVVTGSPGGKH
ncbi:MAG: hypothetical protein WAK93_15245 [Solirubrobacteraceae bacterium]